MAPSIGLLLPTREMVMNGQQTRFQQLLELAVEAEAVGCHAVWVGDSVLARPRFEPLTTLAAVAARTRRITLGTAVLLPALRHPVLLANEVANLDLVCGGRFVLGVGTAARGQPNQREFEAIAGSPFPRRISRFEEALEVMQRLWSGESVTYAGRHFTLEDVSLGLRPYEGRTLPLWLSASEENSLRRVLRFGRGWMMLAPTPTAFATAWQRLQELAAESGRDVSGLGRAVYVTLDIDEDEAVAQSRMRRFLEAYYRGRYEDLIRLHAVCTGPAGKCVEWLRGFLEAGVNTLIVRFDQGDQVQQLHRFAREVMPALRG